jgi:hypothetical protein
MKYKITKVFVVDANDKEEARTKIAKEGDKYLEFVSYRELQSQGVFESVKKPITGK